MAERRLQVTSRLGLHARAAANLVRVASRFQSSLTLQRLDGNSEEADAKSILSILTLAASRGTTLRIVASGVDEQEALDAVVGLFSRDFDEIEKSGAGLLSAKQELRCKGLGVSDGVVIGRVLRLQEGTREVYRAAIAEVDLERERQDVFAPQSDFPGVSSSRSKIVLKKSSVADTRTSSTRIFCFSKMPN